jgi:tetratricopeptide (TPR) repeat protein
MEGAPGQLKPSASTPEPPETSEWAVQDSTVSQWAGVLWPLLVVLLAVLAYAPTLGNGFAFDDTFIIGHNKLITSLRHLPRMFTTEYWGTVQRPDLAVYVSTNLYRPLVILSLALNYAVGGLNPLGYHAVNIGLHTGVSLAVYAVGRSFFLSPAGATVAAALFAVHPLHTEAVTMIVGRAELLMSLGVLLALWGHRRTGVIARLGSLAAFGGALLAKEQAVVLPALLILYDLHAGLRGLRPPEGAALVRRSFLRVLPYVGLLAAYLVLRAWVLGWAPAPAPAFQDNPLAHVPLDIRLPSALAVAGRYLLLCFWPSPLSPDYSYAQLPLVTWPFATPRALVLVVVATGLQRPLAFTTPAFSWVVVLGVLFWGGLLALAFRSFRRGNGAAGCAIALTVFTFLPASNLLVPIGTMMGERLFYLPSVGLCWLAGMGWQRVMARSPSPHLRRAGGAAFGILLLVLMVLTARYSRVWRNNLTLYSYAVQVAPRSAKMRLNLAVELLRIEDRREEAIVHLQRAIQINPVSPELWDTMGIAYLNGERWEFAVAAFQKAVAVDPGYWLSHKQLGLAYTALGRWDDAMAAFRRAVALKPDLAEAHKNLADVYGERGWPEAALAERSLEVNPTDPLAWLQAGTTFLQLDWREQALRAFAQAVTLAPTLPEAHLRLAQAHDLLRHPAEAAAAYEALLRLRPALPAVHRRLAELYSTALPDPAKAAAHRRQAEGTGQ